MPRVNLEILRGPYSPALVSGLHIESCRLVTDISLRRGAEWTAFRLAIIDTGAPVSLLPRRVWDSADVKPMGRFRVGGLIRKPECRFEVTLGLIVMVLRDAAQQIGPVEAHALLAESDEVPTLIGMRGVLTEVVLHSDVANAIAHIEVMP